MRDLFAGRIGEMDAVGADRDRRIMGPVLYVHRKGKNAVLKQVFVEFLFQN